MEHGQDDSLSVTKDLTEQLKKSTASLPLHSIHLVTLASHTNTDFTGNKLQGMNTWLDLSMNTPTAEAYLQHYQSCKRRDPHRTSLMLVVPAHKGVWSRYVQDMQRVSSLKQGTSIYQDRGTGLPYAPLKEDMVLYYDPPLPQLRLHTFATEGEPLHMNFPGNLAGVQTDVLIDTGASHNFIDTRFAKAQGLVIQAERGRVNCGGNTSVAVLGHTYAWLYLRPGYSQMTKLYATDLPDGHPVILGNAWIMHHSAILDHERHEMRFRHGAKRICLKIRERRSAKLGGKADSSREPERPGVINFLQAQVLIRDGHTPILATIRDSRSANDTPSHSPEVVEILDEYSDVFRNLPPGIPPDRGASFTINTGDSAPVCGRGYRLTPMEKDQVEAQVKDFLAKQWIRPSRSPYGAAVLFVQKKDGSLRMCVDYRGLNKATVKDKYPLPRIDDLIDKLHGATVFSSLDLQSGYHQIRIAEKDVHKTAFITPQGLYEYRVMPFGLCNAPSAFQRQMNQMLGHLPFAVVYLDDILVFSRNKAEHQVHLRTVLSILKENQFYAKLSKCSFFQTSTKFLGYVVDQEGIKMDPDKVSAVLSWPLPKNASELRSFLGLCNHYKRFIGGYSTRIAALSELTKSSCAFDLQENSPALQAFKWLKEAMTSAPILAVPNFEAPFTVVTDASGFGIGAVLMQEDASATKRPIAFHSARLSDAERNYPVGEQELLAVISALRKWRCYLEGAKGGVTVVTDHLPNTFLDTKSAEQLSRRQVRWQLELSRINPNWVYEKGQTNAADPLSRCPELLCVSAPQGKPCAHQSFPLPVRNHAVASASLGRKTDTSGPNNSLKSPRSNDERAGGPAILAPVESPFEGYIADTVILLEDIAAWYQADSTSEQTMRDSRIYTFREGLWRYGELVVVPDDYDLRRRCIATSHDLPSSGHPGRAITLEQVQRHFWWPTIRRDVYRYVDTCASCQFNKSSTQRPGGLLKPLPIPDYPWQSMSMDLITHLPTTVRGHTAIVVFVDRLTKMAHLAPSYDTLSAAGFADLFLTEVFRRHGLPESIVSDRDSRFKSAFFSTICSHLGISQNMSSAFHAETDGQTERTNRTLEDMLRHYVGPSQDDWDLRLPCAEFAINNAVKAATGHTPFYLNHGRHPRSPAAVAMDTPHPAANEFVGNLNEAMSRAKDCLAAAQARMKSQADKRRRDLYFSVGDEVLLSSKNMRIRTGTRKFLPKFLGPFQVDKRIGDLAYRLALPPSMGRTHNVFHVSLLRPFKASPDQPLPPMPVLMDGTYEMEVERVLSHRDVKISQKSRRTKREYLVKFAGYGHEHNTWIPVSDCKDIQDLIQEYFHSLKK